MHSSRSVNGRSAEPLHVELTIMMSAKADILFYRSSYSQAARIKVWYTRNNLGNKMAGISGEETSDEDLSPDQDRPEENNTNSGTVHCEDVSRKVISDSAILPPESRVERQAFQSVRDFLYLHRGLFYMILSSICYASLGVFIQLVPSLHALEISSIRAIFLITLPAIGLVVSSFKPTFSKLSKSICCWVALNSILCTATQITMFIAYSLAPVGDVSAIVNNTPLLSGILARIFLKERLTVYDIILTVVSMAGVVLVTKPEFIFGKSDQEGSDTQFIGALWAIAALICLSFLSVVTRKLRSNDSSNASILTLIFGLVALPASAILNTFLGDWTLPVNISEILSLIAVGFVGFLAPHTFNLALKSIKTVSGAVVSTLIIVISYLLQFLVFKTYPDIISGIGVVLILSATFGVFVLKWRESRASEESEDGMEESVDREIKDDSTTNKTEHTFDNPSINLSENN
ncbi:Solute carrier family 35 member G1 [Holothuria leucospilota]|uniref:Solute carrier family 35 member G1 n=1 Tax=Holothuria leucospilota TaxID=206669 RepID=A0A9Q1H047_HOLLE|nr:Solute carrier family 35 member G1 [Holothuria leucospilota]